MDIAKKISDIIVAANRKYAPEGVHPDTMGEEIARQLNLRTQTVHVEGEWGFGARDDVLITGYLT